MIGLINSMMNKIEAMISLLKHPFCLISITLTGLDQNARGDGAAPAGSEQLSVWRGQLSVMTWLKLTMSPRVTGQLHKGTALQSNRKYFKANQHIDIR